MNENNGDPNPFGVSVFGYFCRLAKVTRLPGDRCNVISLRLDREHHKVFRQAFFQKGLPPEAYRKLKLMTLAIDGEERQNETIKHKYRDKD